MATFATIQTTLPCADDDHPVLTRKVGRRDEQLQDYGNHGFRLASTVTVPGTEYVTVIDTLTREDN
ncbi:hypothetical protein [Microbacterium sp. Gd 4-13]|uniref:hypothetical protein n=1 Tax=Microbacterium sp. Gd 4-13 TaxID=2173179 RepID=UPI001057C9CD|nr:hypothetical protein [Microbacterium sp. Gd 4-13]